MERIIDSNPHKRRLNLRQRQAVRLSPVPPLNQQHDQHRQRTTTNFGLGKETIACPQGSPLQHSLIILNRLANTVGPEKNPAHHDQDEGQQHLPAFLPRGQHAVLRNHVPVFPVRSKQNEREKKHRMIRPPSNKCPIGSMPQTAQQENDEGVPNNHHLRAPAASHRNVHVVPEPTRQ